MTPNLDKGKIYCTFLWGFFSLRCLIQIFRGREEYFENTRLRLCQVMQYFPGVNVADDYFDRGNSFNYLYNNALRQQIQSVTSCGTNAVW